MAPANENTTSQTMNPYKDHLFIASRRIKIALGSKNKFAFMEGKHPEPTEGADGIKKWIRCDYMVRSWLLATIKPEIASSLVTMQSTKSLWEEILERYDQTNVPQLFRLKKELWDAEQGNSSVSDYYCKLKGLWDQIADLEGVPECSCGAMAKCSCNLAKKMLDLQATEKFIKFLMGLNDGYDQMKTSF
ncbi:uncharacterized protein [Spinacia oleracea]|uniref:Retrotransposon gag domain-containing protein n=1 Tax=Spinacia oleracea TaxID=3562 RepID=A0A9R0IHU1_SPIOL|nr:uncharacterized protein LOC110789127 [Spinacia oleracea]